MMHRFYPLLKHFSSLQEQLLGVWWRIKVMQPNIVATPPPSRIDSLGPKLMRPFGVCGQSLGAVCVMFRVAAAPEG